MAALGGSFIRVRVHFDYPPPAVVDCRKCWLLVDLNTCRVVADLESIIRDKFGFGRRSILNLFVEDCYLPHTESVYVVRDNDSVRVKVDSLPQVNGGSIHSEPSRETCRKRQRPAEGDEPGAHGASEELKKKKRKNVENEAKQKSSDDSKKKKSGGAENDDKKKKKKKKVEETEPKAKKTPAKVVQLVQNKPKTPQTRIHGNVSSSDSSSSSSEEDAAAKKAKKPAPKPPTSGPAASKAPQKKRQPPPSSSSSSSSSDDEAASTSRTLQNKPQTAAESRSGSKPKPPPTAPPPPPLRPVDATRPASESEEEITLVIKQPKHPPGFGFSQTSGAQAPWRGRGRGMSGRGGAGPRGRGDSRGGFRANGGGGGGGFETSFNGATEPSYETDSLTNTSVVLQNAPRPDYSSLPLLAAPPQVGQKIAFKLLELTENYTPEVSEYKEATILSFDHSSRQVELELQSSCQAPAEPGKFDLVYQNPDGSERVEYAVSRSSRVNELWDSLLEPRLII
ncbi:uncharacterized protein V6R79_013447 [Siganus canaliculatus]